MLATGNVQKTGFTLGKYAPFHKGHKFVIETAISEMNTVIVVIYPAPKETTVSLSTRAGWIRKLFPEVEVIEAENGPEATGYSPQIMELQEKFLLQLLHGRTITHFYSSEPYGEHISKAFGCHNRQVDPDRNTVPISATEIRQNPHQYRSMLDNVVWADLVPGITLLGAPSTGKTTLAEALAAYYQEQYCPEFGRDYWFQHQKNHRLSMMDLEIIAEEQLNLEQQYAEKSERILIADTSPLTTLAYSLYYFGKVSQKLNSCAELYCSRNRRLFLCDTNIPFDNSWDRSGPGSRSELQAINIKELKNRALSYDVVSGTVAQRVKLITDYGIGRI